MSTGRNGTFQICGTSIQNTLSYKDTDTIVGILRHCLLDEVAQGLIKEGQCASKELVEEVDGRLNKEGRGAKSTDMDVEKLNPLVTSLRTLHLCTVEKYLDNYKGTGACRFACMD